MDQLASGNPALCKARNPYRCETKGCVLHRDVSEGEVHVAVHETRPQRSGRKVLTHLRHDHFSVRYHVKCFFQSETTDRRTRMLSYDLEDLENFDEYGDEARRVLED